MKIGLDMGSTLYGFHCIGKRFDISRLMRIWMYFKAAEIELDSAGLQVRQPLK